MSAPRKPAAETARGGVILFVCTANLARSPLAAELMQRGLTRHGGKDLRVESAGTQVMAGSRLPSVVLDVAQDHGIDLSGHKPRQVHKDTLARADLVIAMTEAHRASLVRLAPGAIPRTFTLLELRRLTETTTAGVLNNPAQMALAAHRARPVTPPSSAPEDIDDPIGKSTRHLRRVTAQLHDLVDALSLLLADKAHTAPVVLR